MNNCNNKLEKAGIVIPHVLQENKLLIPYKLYRVKLNWKTIMGQHIAKYSYVKKFEKNTVVIGVLNPVWMNHLFLYKKKIMDDINLYIHEKIITDIQFVRSGKKPASIVYKTIDDTEEKLFPSKNIRTIVLSNSVVDHIKKETAHLPEGLKDKVQQMRFSQEKRKLAYRSEHFIPCPLCGRWIHKEESICFLCRIKERRVQKKKVYDILMQMPWLSIQEIQQYISCSTVLYDEVRRDCIYRLIDKVYTNADTKEDDLFLALFILRKQPAELTDQFIVNLTEKYRRHKHVSAYRR